VSLDAAGFALLAGGAGFGAVWAARAKLRDLDTGRWIAHGGSFAADAGAGPAESVPGGKVAGRAWFGILGYLGLIQERSGWMRSLSERMHAPAKIWLGASDPGREAWLGGKTVLGLSCAVLAGWLLDDLTIGLACGAAAFFVPDFLARGIHARRQEAIRRELPDFLDLLTLALEAGVSPDSGMKQVAEKLRGGIIARETERMLAEIRFGARRHAAWRDMAARLGNPEMIEVTGALVQADAMGVGMAQSLKGLASQMRVRRRYRVEELAHKAPVKLLFPLVFFVFPAVFIVLLGPVFLQLVEVLR
jgi:tight adherence protein C